MRVTPPMNFTFSDDSLFLKKRFLAGDINSLNLLVKTNFTYIYKISYLMKIRNFLSKCMFLLLIRIAWLR